MFDQSYMLNYNGKVYVGQYFDAGYGPRSEEPSIIDNILESVE